MKKNKNRYISSVLLVLIILQSASIYFPINSILFESIHEERDALNLSDDEVIIITPENKTYLDPDSGYYPATYGFESDEDGLVPEGWADLDGASCYSHIITGLDGHNKVLEQTDNFNGQGCVIKQTFTSKIDHGTIEYYARVSSIIAGTKMAWRLWSDSGLEIMVITDGSNLRYYDGGVWHDIISSGLTSNTWYHISVRWRSSGAPLYQGLNEGEWKIFVNEVEYGNYALVYDDNMTSLTLETGAAPDGFSVYWDAIGFDWIDDYTIGDNLNEGLLLSYDSSLIIDWLGYSLNGGTNKTIMGNTTLLMLADGSYNIQVFLNDTMGYKYSDIQYFSVSSGPPDIVIISPIASQTINSTAPSYELSINGLYDSIWYTLDGGTTNITSVGLTGTIEQTEWEKQGNGPVTIGFYANNTGGFEGYAEVTVNKNAKILINSPENKTYVGPMIGYYPATYGFENDEDGSFPMEWIDESTGTLSEVEVASEVAGHKKVLHYYSYSTQYSITKLDLSSPQTTGSIEYYVYKEGGPKGFEIQLRNSTGDYALRIGIDYNYDHKFIWRTSGSTAAEFGAGKFSLETWFHLRIDFNLMTNKFDIYLDGVKEVDQEDFFYEINSLQNIGFSETFYNGGSNWYLDALSFSWDPNYIVGENLNEGLLLSFENSTTPDWISYSLDGQANNTILGNFTIPMPDDGPHSIQVFANDSLDANYQSDVRYFSVDTGSPDITITTPSQNEFFGVVPPNFEISILKPNISKIWYTLDNGITNITSAGLTGTINQIEWEKKGGGPVTIRFYANDTLGFEGYSEVTVNKDTGSPEITIITPVQDTFFGVSSPSFEITIIEPNLNTTWYTFNNGATNTTFTGLSGTIAQTVWDSVYTDDVILRFYANDSSGLEGYSEVSIKKDLQAPHITIVHEALTFTITADDGSGSGVALIRYRINGSAWIDYTSPFSVIDYGHYNFTIQAIDEVGNIRYDTLIIALREPDDPYVSPDWTMFIMTSVIIGGIGLVIVITLLIRKRNK